MQLPDPDLLANANTLPGRCRSRLQTRGPLRSALACAVEHKHLCTVSCGAQARGLGRTSTQLPGYVLCSQKPSTTEVQCLSPKPPCNLLLAVALKKTAPAQMTARSPVLSVPNMSHTFSRYRLPTYRPRAEYLPPVRLKEFPKAENELRGVKSGLLGLLTGLHKPELNVARENTQNGG